LTVTRVSFRPGELRFRHRLAVSFTELHAMACATERHTNRKIDCRCRTALPPSR